MPRLTISLTANLHNRLSALSVQYDESLSNIINRLTLLGLHHLDEEPKNLKKTTLAEQYCQQLIIQINALVKNMAKEILRLEQNDFDQLQRATIKKCDELYSAD